MNYITAYSVTKGTSGCNTCFSLRRFQALHILILCLVSLLGACVHNPDKEPYELSTEANPLLGKIWDTQNESFISEEALMKRLTASSVVMLGETHDNIEHHKLQAKLISEAGKWDRANAKSGAVAFEMISDKQGELLAAHSGEVHSSEDLIHIIQGEKSQWKYAIYYKPVFDQALAQAYRILPANIDRSALIKMIMQGPDAVPEAVADVLAKAPLSEKAMADMTKEIESAHCGMQLGKQAESMIVGQRTRDATMAKTIVDGLKSVDRVILVAGSGHVREDRGAPFYLRRLGVEDTLTIAFMEVSPNKYDLIDYMERWGVQRFPFDYVWFTPYANRPDPCKDIEKHMKHMKAQKAEDKKSPE